MEAVARGQRGAAGSICQRASGVREGEGAHVGPRVLIWGLEKSVGPVWGIRPRRGRGGIWQVLGPHCPGDLGSVGCSLGLEGQDPVTRFARVQTGWLPRQRGCLNRTVERSELGGQEQP